MLIIEENTLTHVDSVSDIIEHYGVKGMKWRKGTQNGVEAMSEEEKQQIFMNRYKNLDNEYKNYASAMRASGNTKKMLSKADFKKKMQKSLTKQYVQSKRKTINRDYVRYHKATRKMGQRPMTNGQYKRLMNNTYNTGLKRGNLLSDR